MNARINITTPAGKSLEGFPRDLEPFTSELGDIVHSVHQELGFHNTQLHKGDIITIEVL